MARGDDEGEEVCDVAGCQEPVERSLPFKKVKKQGFEVESSGRRAKLCKEHYKEFRKATKKDRQLEQLGR